MNKRKLEEVQKWIILKYIRKKERKHEWVKKIGMEKEKYAKENWWKLVNENWLNKRKTRMWKKKVKKIK